VKNKLCINQAVLETKMDSGEAAFFARELEYLEARTYDTLFPEFPALRLLPGTNEAGPGAEYITYRQYTPVGQMKVGSTYADDLPYSDVFAKEFHTKIKSLIGAFRYSLQEVRNAQYAGIPLEQRKANSARQSYEQTINRYSWLADGSSTFSGIYGLFYNPNITVGPAKNGGWLAGATPDQIIDDVNALINEVPPLTKGVEYIDTIVMPRLQFGYISTKPRSIHSDMTILKFLQENHPGVTFEAINEAAAITAPSGSGLTVDVMCGYRKSPEKMKLHIPQPFEMLPIEPINLYFKIPTHGRFAGLILYYPLSVSLKEGI
jgi:hypothetical protein